MLVGMYYNNKKVEVEELPIPEIGDNDILIKVIASGICGSDVLEWYRIKKAPLVLGHEVAGEIVETGKNIRHLKEGDRVFSTHHVPCEECYFCKKGHETACEVFHTKNNFTPGGFSQYLKVSGKSVHTGTLLLPDTMSFEEGSFIEPLGTVVRGLRAINIHEDDTIAILGCGIAGLLMLKLARAKGVKKIIVTDINEFRLSSAEKFGAIKALKPNESVEETIKEINEGRLADKVIVCAGSLDAARQSLRLVERGGTILFFAVPNPNEVVEIDFTPFWRNDISIKTCYGAAPIDNKIALELIDKKIIQVSELITHRFGIKEIQKAFSIAVSGEDCLKIIIEPFGT
ncbi:MAG TPA: alcohol dehydrogenase catalytic domain-containing protein [Syntrophorhabdaceae bacterium]|nr:alcohol dehydrogenase catalytic domain-containing protein [Syntrophorhabdaceae bacterium]